MRGALIVFLALATGVVFGQSGVSAVYRDGQTFVTFDEGAAPPMTYEIYVSESPILLTANGTKVGRIFDDEWRGKSLQDGATDLLGFPVTFRVPASGGGYRNLGAWEGVFVRTVRSTALLYYSVVPFGATVITPAQQTQSPVLEVYSANDPVRPHYQFQKNIDGFDHLVYVTWALGDDDHTAGRPDYPVTANFNKNGMPRCFVLSMPETGPGQGPYPLSLALHGGQGQWWQFRPGFFANIGNRISSGLMVGPGDDLVHNQFGTQEHSLTKWFGYAEDYDPFEPNSFVNPPAGTIVRNYTQRYLDWLLEFLRRPSTGLEIDPERISVYGHSAGGRGASLYSRYRADLFTSCYMYTPALRATGEDVPNRMHGTPDLNLDTNLIVDGQPVKFWESFGWDVRLNNLRDLPFTKVWCGKMEFEDGQGPDNHWDAERVALMHTVNDSKVGFHLFWDRRDHAVPDWSDEDPNNTWVDVGEWITSNPLQRTARDNTIDQARNLLHRSYPGFYNTDEDLNTNGRQPDPGNGDPFDGANFGTWGGYIDWDVATIVDTQKSWACTAWLVGESPILVDNYPGTTLLASMTIRRPQRFRPATGAPVSWKVRDMDSGTVLQSGTATVGPNGLVDIVGIRLTKFPLRCRIEVQRMPSPIHSG